MPSPMILLPHSSPNQGPALLFKIKQKDFVPKVDA